MTRHAEPSARSAAMTISQLAEAAGIPTSTIRYYERCGLLMPTSRSAAKYRLYGSEALRKVHFVRSAQAVGFALDDIAALFALDKAKGTCCQLQVRELLEKRLAETEDRLRDLERVRSALREALQRCKASGDDDCAVMLDLASPAVESAPANGRVRTPRTGGEAVRPPKTVPK